MRRLISVLLQSIILFYKGAISPLFAPCCRYTPSCSEYALKAVRKHGPRKGFLLTIKRLSKCHPCSGSGYDPVP